MSGQSNAVFVSYRRDVSQFLAQALWQNLTERGIDVFYDLETIHAGQFEAIILAQIASRPYMVPIFQRGALNRCVDEGDWFRLEIEAALESDRMLVPVFTPEFEFEDIEHYLPEKTASALRGFNMLEIPPKYFKYAIQELAENYLTHIDRELLPLTPGAQVAAATQAAAIDDLPTVTTETLTAEEFFARGYDAGERGDNEAAIDANTQAIRLNPSYAMAFINRAGALLNLGKYEEAITDCDEAIRLDPSLAMAFYNRGTARQNLGNYEEAITDFDEAIRLDPSDAMALTNRAYAHLNLGNYEEAITDCDEAIRLNPTFPEAFNNRGYAHQNLGKYEEAITDYDEAIRLNPTFELALSNRRQAGLLRSTNDTSNP